MLLLYWHSCTTVTNSIQAVALCGAATTEASLATGGSDSWENKILKTYSKKIISKL